MVKDLVSTELSIATVFMMLMHWVLTLAVYVYVYLHGQRVTSSGGGTTINWSTT